MASDAPSRPWGWQFMVGDEAGLDAWLEDQDARVAHFVDFSLPMEITGDYSRSSLVALDEYVQRRWPGRSPLDDDDVDLDFLDGAIRYVGETFLRHFGGRWVVQQESNAIFPGHPVLWLDVPDTIPGSPLHWIMLSALGTRKVTLTSVFDFNVEKKKAAITADPETAVAELGRVEPGEGSGDPDRAHPMHPDVRARTEAWTNTVPQLVADLQRELPDLALDFSRESLERLQPVVGARVPGAEAFTDPAHRRFVDAVTAYTGECVLRHVERAYWMRPLGAEADVEDIYDGWPLVLVPLKNGELTSLYPFDAVRCVATGEAPDDLVTTFDVGLRP